ncbi:juvenile hormone acid O-methyltransferase isoform X2 [Monomorium pharaonis]|nr:juvenile hormone acid O-methyltransferase isoform X2 [Monomorium pharaonis]
MDIGCGPGDITNDILLSALDPNAVIIGTDISKSMIEHAQKMYGDNKRLKFEVLDIETKNLPVKFISEFNHIFSFYTLQWCSNMWQTFENIYRMLRPGGTILIIFVAAHDSLLKVLGTIAQDDRFAPYMQNYTEKYALSFNDSISDKKLKDLLESIGFYIHHCSLRELNIFDSENLLLSVMSTFAFLDKMPSNRKEEFKINFASKYIEKKIQLYGNKQDNIKDETVLDRHKILITYAQKNIS